MARNPNDVDPQVLEADNLSIRNQVIDAIRTLSRISRITSWSAAVIDWEDEERIYTITMEDDGLDFMERIFSVVDPLHEVLGSIHIGIEHGVPTADEVTITFTIH